jgi:hypothetical protein
VGQRTVTSAGRLTGGLLLLGAAASCALAAAALSSAGSAHATCVSINGIGNGGGCTSSPTSFAVGLGPGTTADAQGFFNGAFSVGADAETTSTGVGNFAAAVGNRGLNGSVMAVVPTDAVAKGTFNRAIAFGNGSGSAAIGTNGTAFLLGNGSDAIAAGSVPPPFTSGDSNTAFTLGNFSSASAIGNHHLALAFGNHNTKLNTVG